MLRALGLGDLLTAVPALRGVRSALPDHRLVLATSAALEPLVALAGVADVLLPADGLSALRWPGPAPEVAVNLHGRGPQSHQVLSAVSPRSLVGYACAEADCDGPAWRPGEHEVLRWCRLVEVGLGALTDPDDLDLAAPDRRSEWAGAAVVHPGAAFGSRRWPPERFAAVCRRLTAAGQRVVVTGSKAEMPLAASVVGQAELPPDADLSGRLDLSGLAGLVAASSLVVCGDTGVAHLASAYRRPSVLLFGPVSPALWGPPRRPQHVVLWHGDGAGDPWGDAVDPALARISVEDVVDAYERLLSRAS